MRFFPTTIWAEIIKAKDGKQTVLNDLIKKYQSPVFNFIRKMGVTENDAQDLTQEVFLAILENKILQKANQAKGKFRSLILGVTKNIIKRYYSKKLKEKRLFSEDKEKSIEELLVTEIKDEDFDREWMHNLINIALKKLSEENKKLSDVIRFFFYENKSQKEIAQIIGKSEKNVRDYVYYAKQKLRKYILEEIKNTSSSQEEYESEVKYFLDYWNV